MKQREKMANREFTFLRPSKAPSESAARGLPETMLQNGRGQVVLDTSRRRWKGTKNKQACHGLDAIESARRDFRDAGGVEVTVNSIGRGRHVPRET